MTHDPDKAPNTGEPTPMTNDEFRREASAFLSDKPEPTFTPEPQPDRPSRPEAPAPWEKRSTWNAETTPATETKKKEGRSVLFPAALILLGGLALAYNFGLVQPVFWYWLSRLWPIWLIVAGLDIVISRRKRWFGWVMLGLVVTIVSGAIWGGQTIWNQVNATGGIVTGSGEATPITYMLEDAKEADVRLSPGIAQLMVGATGSDEALAEGTIYSPPGLQARTNLERLGDRAILSVSQRDTGGIRIGTFEAQPWEVHLSPKIPMRLTVDGGVGRSDLDLRDLQVTSLTIKSGVGQTEVTLPATGKLTGTIDAGVGRVVVRVPRSMGAQIRTSTGIGGVSVHGTFEQNGRTYTTPGYAQSANQADLSIDGGIGSIEIELID